MNLSDFWNLLNITKQVQTVNQSVQDSKKEILNHMSKQDDAIAAFKTDVDAQFAKFGTALDNIAADEKGLADQIKLLQTNASSELSAANQSTLDGILATATAMATRSQAVADSVPDAPTPTP